MVQFDDLNGDILCEILKYLPLADRTRFERVSSRFKSTINHLWSQQLSLAFVADIRHHESHWSCNNRAHQVGGCDVVTITSEINFEVVEKLLQKCKKLKSLVYTHKPSEDFGAVLTQKCPRLEHLEVVAHDDFTCMLDFDPSVLTCLKIVHSLDVWTVNEQTLAQIQQLLRCCTKLLYFSIDTVTRELLLTITTVRTIEKLSLGQLVKQKLLPDHELANVDYNTIAKTMPHLKSIQINGQGNLRTFRHNFSCLVVSGVFSIEEFEQLREVSSPQRLQISPCPFIDNDNFCEQYAKHLITLRLSVQNLFLLDIITSSCVNLENFYAEVTRVT